MFRASLCPSSGERLYKTACCVSLDVLAAVVWSRDTSGAHAVGGCRKKLALPELSPNDTYEYIIRKVANGSTTITGAMEAMEESTTVTT